MIDPRAPESTATPVPTSGPDPRSLRRTAGLVELSAVAISTLAIGMLANNWSDTVLIVSFGQPQPQVTAEQESRWVTWTLIWAAAMASGLVAAGVRRRRLGGTMWWHLSASVVGLAAIALFHVAPRDARPPADDPTPGGSVCHSGGQDCLGG